MDENVRGFTLIELIVAVSLFGVLLGAGVPHLAGGGAQLWGAHAQLLADLRQARADALSRGDHFQLSVTGSGTYEVRRLRDDDDDGEWTPDASPVRMRTLPDAVRFVGGVGAAFEFNTRGLMVSPGDAAPLLLHDAHSGVTRTVTVWPSGQVAPVEMPS